MPTAIDPATLPYRPCAGICLINNEGLVFAGRRIDGGETAGNLWQMPQGGIDEGETPDVAALREMEEEIGTRRARLVAQVDDWIPYDLPSHLLGKIWKGKYRGQKQKWFLFRFEGEDKDISIETAHPEFSTWSWMRADDLIAQTVPFKRAVYARVFAEFADHLK